MKNFSDYIILCFFVAARALQTHCAGCTFRQWFACHLTHLQSSCAPSRGGNYALPSGFCLNQYSQRNGSGNMLPEWASTLGCSRHVTRKPKQPVRCMHGKKTIHTQLTALAESSAHISAWPGTTLGPSGADPGCVQWSQEKPSLLIPAQLQICEQNKCLLFQPTYLGVVFMQQEITGAFTHFWVSSTWQRAWNRTDLKHAFIKTATLTL